MLLPVRVGYKSIARSCGRATSVGSGLVAGRARPLAQARKASIFSAAVLVSGTTVRLACSRSLVVDLSVVGERDEQCVGNERGDLRAGEALGGARKAVQVDLEGGATMRLQRGLEDGRTLGLRRQINQKFRRSGPCGEARAATQLRRSRSR